MEVYRGDMATEGKRPKFIRQENGCEMISNAGDVKIVLARIVSFSTEIEQEFYSTKVYIREDTGWLLTNNTHNYPSEDAFYDAIRDSEDFSEAVREMDSEETEV